jgi:hypothetical protein
MDKHSSLLSKSVNYGRKKFYSTGSWVELPSKHDRLRPDQSNIWEWCRSLPESLTPSQTRICYILLWKKFPRQNTLAYFDAAPVTQKDSFVTPTEGLRRTEVSLDRSRRRVRRRKRRKRRRRRIRRRQTNDTTLTHIRCKLESGKQQCHSC